MEFVGTVEETCAEQTSRFGLNIGTKLMRLNVCHGRLRCLSPEFLVTEWEALNRVAGGRRKLLLEILRNACESFPLFLIFGDGTVTPLI